MKILIVEDEPSLREGLVDLLSRQLAGAAANRIRRANFLDLVAEVLARCKRRIDDATAAVGHATPTARSRQTLPITRRSAATTRRGPGSAALCARTN